MHQEIIKSENHMGTKLFPVIMLIIGVLSFILAECSMSNRKTDIPILMFYLGIALMVISIILLLYINSCSLCVTNSKVYGKAAFGKRVDLPTDSISAIAMGMFNSVSIATASGRISFIGIKNRDEIYKVISDIISNRTVQKTSSVTNITQQVESNADELKKFKDLLDSGIITQEEYGAKKKQLLGL